ncbi:MAG: hypothetical protein NC039_08355 [Muribaculaceae bacterium]|nr:hypothetical protein [Muribaculaceae bacterium]
MQKRTSQQQHKCETLALVDYSHHNLRPDIDTGYVGVGSPRRIMLKNSRVRVVDGLCYAHGDGTETFFYSVPGKLMAYNTAGREQELAAVIGDVCHGITDGDGVIVFGEDGSPRRFVCDKTGRWEEREISLDITPYIIERRDMSVETAEVADVKLAGTYDQRNHQLTSEDADKLGTALSEAYRHLVDGAAGAGCMVQPVLARYRLYGLDGRVLYTSAPVMVAPADGVQAVSGEALVSAGESTVSGMRLTARAFRLELVPSVVADPLRDTYVGRVELMVSPQLHPYIDGVPANCSYKGADGGVVRYEVNIPGYTEQSSPVKARMLSVLANVEKSFRPDATVVPTLKDDLKTLSSLQIGGSAAPFIPSAFKARCSARNGSSVLYGGLTFAPFSGYALPEMAIVSEATEWGIPTAVRVTMADGSTVVRAVTSGRTMSALSPLLLYPSPEARSMLIITDEGRMECPLTPSPCGRWSYWVNPGCVPLSPPEGGSGFILPSASPSDQEYPDALAVASADDPLRLLTVTHAGVGRVTALAAAPRSGMSWDFARAGFYAMGVQGIAGVQPSSALTSVHTSIIDKRGVKAGRCVAQTVGGVAAVAGGELLQLTGSRVKTLLSPCDADMVGYSTTHQGLLYGSAEGSALNLLTTPLNTISPGVSALIALSDRLIGVDEGSGRFYDLSVEVDGDQTIEITAVARIDASGWTRGMLRLPISGRSLYGTVRITPVFTNPINPINSTPTPWLPATTLTLRGDIDHPVVSHVLLPHCHGVRVEVKITTPYPKYFRYDP